MKDYNFFVYIVTNPNRKVLYTGVTNDLEQRVIEHFLNRGNQKSFAGRYFCYCLLYFERFENIDDAIEREKQIKGWTRKKKEELIEQENPKWNFLNKEIIEEWPPKDASAR